MKRLEDEMLLCPAGSERRSRKRYNVFLPCHLAGISNGIFMLCDVSETGCKLRVSEATGGCYFRTGGKYTLEISPDGLNTDRTHFKPFSLNARLVWERHLADCTQLGFKLETNTSSDFQVWLKFIDIKCKKLHPSQKRLV